MRTKQVVVGDKSLTLIELRYVDFIKISKIRDNPEEHNREVFKLSGVSQEVIDVLNIKEGLDLIKEIADFNRFSDFPQTPSS